MTATKIARITKGLSMTMKREENSCHLLKEVISLFTSVIKESKAKRGIESAENAKML